MGPGKKIPDETISLSNGMQANKRVFDDTISEEGSSAEKISGQMISDGRNSDGKSSDEWSSDERISKEELDRAFDARFPAWMKEKLTEARVAVAGLGGLGSNIAVSLARSGVGHLLLVDFDVVDVTNLNRQMYMIPHLGRPKTEALRDILAQINPYLDVETHRVRVTAENIPAIFRGWPIVCEAFDRPDQKAMLVGTLLAAFPDTVIISGNGMAGLGDANTIRTQQKLRRLYVCGDDMTDAAPGNGLMAPRVAICAGHQANKVLQLITGSDSESNLR